MATARIIACYGKNFIVEHKNEQQYYATLRRTADAVCCGDWVDIEWIDHKHVVIENVQPRSNLLCRSDRQRTKLMAANISQVAIMLAAVPPFAQDWLNRCLLAAEYSAVKIVIIFNKIDLAQAQQQQLRLQPYQVMGYPLVSISAQHDISALLPLLQHQSSVLLGQSGVGKSTLINTLLGKSETRIGALSKSMKGGRHTTSYAMLYRYADIELIDLPGVQHFGLQHIPAQQLASLFVELRPYLGKCRFNNCDHQHSQGCALQQAVDNKAVLPQRLALLRQLYSEYPHRPSKKSLR